MAGVATEQIVIELSHEVGEPGLIHGQLLYGKVFDAIRDLSIFNMPTWYMAKLSLNDYNALEWPDSCIVPLMVCLKRNGRSLALAVSNEMVNEQNYSDTNHQNNLLDADAEIQDFFRVDGFEQEWSGIFNWGLGEVYGLKSMYGGVGLVSHNKGRRQSFISGVTLQDGDTFEFFFKSDGLGEECPDFVPSECKEAIEFFALSKYYRSRNPNLASDMRNKYKEEFYRLQRLYEDGTEKDWADVMNSNVISAPKI